MEQGEFFLLSGVSGCGKTTLLRQLKPAIAPYGSREGTILYEGRPLESLNKRRTALEIGFVFQSPDAQIVTDRVSSELAFGLENAGVAPAEIRRRVAEMAGFFGIESWYHKQIEALSGGQRQMLNLASVLVMKPKVLILDEPTSQLDPVSAGNFIGMLEKLNRELGQTILLTEHRQEELFPLADRVGLMAEGRLKTSLPPKEMAAFLLEREHPLAKALPTPAKTAWGLGERENLPLTMKDGRRFLADFTKGKGPVVIRQPEKPEEREKVISARNVFFRYQKDGPDVLRDFSLTLERGQCLAVLGGNGAGKTTLLQVLAGILPPYRGKIKRDTKKIAYLSQNPRSVFLKETLEEDFALVQQSKESWRDKLNGTELFRGLLPLLQRNPMDLSGGELQKAALFKVILTEPDVILLDEPTKGLDPFAKEELGCILKEWRTQGKSLVLVTHDIAFSARYAARCAFLFDGEIVSQGTPGPFFSTNQFYTTAACKMSRDILGDAVTGEEVIRLAAGADR